MGFSADVRALTTDVHAGVEDLPFLRDLARGRLRLAAYVALAAQHHHIYRVLEEAAATMRDDPVAGPFVDDRLTRLPALEADLNRLAGDDWPPAVPATDRYVARLKETCFDWPGGFIAHHYTRYLGDLSGGFYIGAAVRRAYGLGSAGTAFYVFDRIGVPKEYKDGYRERLDAVDWDAAERERVAAEVVHAYRLNADVLTDLWHQHGGGTG